MRDSCNFNCRRLSELTLIVLLLVHWRIMSGIVVVAAGRLHRRQERTLLSSFSTSNLTPVDIADDSINPLAIEQASTQTVHRVFEFRDCGASPDRPVRVLNMSVNPHPIRTPGKVKVSALINVSETLPSTLAADLIVSKYFLGRPLKIPCFHNVGTCHYDDVCSLLDSMFPTNDDCPRVLRRHRLPCRCPFLPGLLHLARYSFYIPPLTGIMQLLAAGEYDARVRLYDQVNKRELGCLQIRFDLRKKRPRRHNTAPSSESHYKH